MKKRVLVVTDFEGALSQLIEENLREVFGDKIEIAHHHLRISEDDEIQGDVILFMLENRILMARKKIKDMSRVLVISRTILEKRAMEIMKIPRGSRVLVVNDYYETTLQLTSLLYKLKIKDLKFVSYKEGGDYSDIQYAVTPGIPERVPGHIEKVIDVGVRCLDTETLVYILNKLEINDEEVQFRLLKYMSKVVTVEEGMKEQYRYLHEKNEQLKSILEKSNDGILLVNSDGEVLLGNDRAKIMLGITGRITRSKIDQVVERGIKDMIRDRHQIDNEMVMIKGKYIMVSAKTSSNLFNRWEKVIILKDITHIKKLEQTVSHKLKSAGLSAKYTFEKILYRSESMKSCIEMAKRFAGTHKTILIHGESGTGKELLAQSIHNESKRSKYPFVAINCAALPESLLESELFGYDKGAFTGAKKEGKIGLFEQANNGTIFLDEIGDMPYGLQSRLLRVLQERQVMRIGSDRVIDVDVRIISATNKHLMKEIDRGEFREDLYYRLCVLPLKVPSLRERKEDIVPLFRFYSGEDKILPGVLDSLIQYSWRGNVRELKNAAEYYSLMKDTENPLPETLQYIGEDDGEFDIGIKILSIVYKNSRGRSGIGRSAILKTYNDEYHKISEYRLRNVLEQLKDGGFISGGMGRAGCIITEEGENYLKGYKK